MSDRRAQEMLFPTRHRAEEGRLLRKDDPRVQAALKAAKLIPGWSDWRDIAEIVNAVLEADDMIDHAAMRIRPSQIEPYGLPRSI